VTAVTVILRRLLGRKLGTRPARPGEHRPAVYPRARCGAVLVGEWWPWVQRRFPVAARYYVPDRQLAPGGSLRLSLGIRSCARGEPGWGTPSASARTGTSDSARRRGLVPSPCRCGRRCLSRAQRRSTRALAKARRSGGGGRAGVADLLPGFFFGGFQEFPRDGSHRYIAWLDGAWVGLGAGVDLHVGGELGLGPDDLTSGSQPSLNSGHVPKVPSREGFSPSSAAATPPKTRSRAVGRSAGMPLPDRRDAPELLDP
jgi:hypothetical protein